MKTERSGSEKNPANEAKRNLCADGRSFYSPAPVQRNEQNIFIKVEILNWYEKKIIKILMFLVLLWFNLTLVVALDLVL